MSDTFECYRNNFEFEIFYLFCNTKNDVDFHFNKFVQESIHPKFLLVTRMKKMNIEFARRKQVNARTISLVIISTFGFQVTYKA